MILQSHFVHRYLSVYRFVHGHLSVRIRLSVCLWSINAGPLALNPRMLKSHIWFSVSMGFESVDSMNLGWELESTVGWICRCKNPQMQKAFCIYWKSPCQSSNPSCLKVSDISKVNEITCLPKRYLHPKAIGKAWETCVHL